LAARDGCESEVGDYGWEVELETCGADGEEGPAEGEEPGFGVAEDGDYFVEVKVGFCGKGGVAGEAGFDEGFFVRGEPFCLGWD